MKKSTLRKITPLKIFALLTFIAALQVAFSIGRDTFLLVGLTAGLPFFILAFIFYQLDRLTTRTKSSKTFWISQIALSTAFVVGATFFYLDLNKHNLVVLPNGFQGHGGIVFGIEGYPELPKMKYWKRAIEIPSNGILFTSTKDDDLVDLGYSKFQYKDGSELGNMNSSVHFSNAMEYPCIFNRSVIKYYSFQIGNTQDSSFREVLFSLCDSVN
jgi:hypothetical protein